MHSFFNDPRELTNEEIKDIINKFINAAKIAGKAGFDGVQFGNLRVVFIYKTQTGCYRVSSDTVVVASTTLKRGKYFSSKRSLVGILSLAWYNDRKWVKEEVMAFQSSDELQLLLEKVTAEQAEVRTSKRSLTLAANRTYNIYVAFSLLLSIISILLLFANGPVWAKGICVSLLLVSLIGLLYNKYRHMVRSKVLEKSWKDLRQEEERLRHELVKILDEESRYVIRERFKVAGTSYQQEQLEKLLARVQADPTYEGLEQVRLVPEPDNAYDDKALQVYIADRLVGYVPQVLTQRLVRYIGNDRYLMSGRARLYHSQHGTGQTYIGVEVDFKLLEKHA